MTPPPARETGHALGSSTTGEADAHCRIEAGVSFSGAGTGTSIITRGAASLLQGIRAK